jgi:isoprenylcysteine carboxyl methyltransferase (ICMT) family protein YpbQ
MGFDMPLYASIFSGAKALVLTTRIRAENAALSGF